MKKNIPIMLIIVFTLLACNQSNKESKTVTPKQTETVGLFKIQAKEKTQDIVEFTIINTLLNAKGFAYNSDPNAAYGEIVYCLSDTLVLALPKEKRLQLYQFQKRTDGGGYNLQPEEIIVVKDFL